MDLRQSFFSGFRRKHLFITTCIEKQCTRPLNWLQLVYIKFLLIYLFLFVQVPRPEDSEVTYLVFKWSCHLLLPVWPF